MSSNSAQKLFLSLMGVIFPPLPIFILKRYDIFNKEILVSVILTLLGHLPGVIFSIYYIYVLSDEIDEAPGASSGYTRLDDDNDSDNLQASQSHHNELGISHVVRPEIIEGMNDEPPQYEAISGSGNQPRPDQKVFNDNKVQE